MSTKPSTVVLASNNSGKLVELQHLLADCGLNVVPQTDFKLASVEETGLSFVENAILKARYACAQTKFPAIADDSGLEVDALQGAPGIYSARYAGVDASDQANNDKLLHELINIPDSQRSARFQCILVYMRHALDPTPVICQGTWEGQIMHKPEGNNGFGYDPLFFVPDQNCASAQLPKALKSTLSHRSQALKKLLAVLKPATNKAS